MQLSEEQKRERISEYLEGIYLEERKKERRLSYAELARRMGIPPSDLSRYINKIALPNEETQSKIARYMGTPDIYLALGRSTEFTDLVRVLMGNWDNLSKETKEKIIDLIRGDNLNNKH